ECGRDYIPPCSVSAIPRQPARAQRAQREPNAQVATVQPRMEGRSAMAVREIRVVLSAADPTGQHPDPDEVAGTLAVDGSPYLVYGHDTTGNAVGIRIFSLSYDEFRVESEPGRRRIDWSAFHKAITDALVTFAQWLSRISVDALNALRSRGLDVYV